LRSGDLVKSFREKKELTQRQLADKTGTTNPMISRWESNQNFPGYELALNIAEELGIPENELLPLLQTDRSDSYVKSRSVRRNRTFERLKKSEPKPVQMSAKINITTEATAKLTVFHQVPILGQVPAGQLQEILPKMRNEADEWELIPVEGIPNPELLFGLHIVGESMIGKDIQDGDVIIIDTSIQPSNGDIVVAMVNDSATVKTFYRSGDILTLQSANAKIEPIVLRENDKDSVRIVGKVIRVIKKL
jgi:SOS regulatory protein LexA